MRFASLNNSNARDYAQAGKEASNALADSFSIMRKTGPDYAMLSKVAMATRSAEKVASLKAQAFVGSKGLTALGNVTTAGIKARTGVKFAEMKGDRIRKAGKVAAIGGILGGAVLAATNKKEDNSWKDKYDQQRDAINQAYLKTLDSDDAEAGTTEFKPRKFEEWQKLANGGFSAQGGAAQKTGAPSSGPAISSAQALASGKGSAGSGSKYSVAQMQALLEKNGMTPANARILAAVGMGESGGNSGIDTVQSGLDPKKSNEYSLGLFQINAQAHGDKLSRRGWTSEDLRDPNKNAAIAVEVFREAGNSFRPWSVYQKGLHKQFLQ